VSTTDQMSRRFLVTRVRLCAYKSHAACDVALRPLSFLVGLNGSGKSNFMDALCFVSDSLRSSVGEALRDRHGIAEVVWRGREDSDRFGIRIDFECYGQTGHYAFAIVRTPDDAHEVDTEECFLDSAGTRGRKAYFRIENNTVVESTVRIEREMRLGALYLPTASNYKVFGSVFEHLRNMSFYRLSAEAMRGFVARAPEDRLIRDGSNAASVVRALEDRAPDAKRYVVEYLSRVVPGLLSADRKIFGNLQTIEFLQKGGEPERNWRFLAHSMSDGTLHALGVLLAAFQSGYSAGTLVGIEEPESAVNAAVAGILTAALEEASDRRQILVSTQGADLLDEYDVPIDSVIAVAVRNGRSHIGPIDEVGQSLLRDKHLTPGELMRAGQLRPEFAEVDLDQSEASLFGPAE